MRCRSSDITFRRNTDGFGCVGLAFNVLLFFENEPTWFSSTVQFAFKDLFGGFAKFDCLKEDENANRCSGTSCFEGLYLNVRGDIKVSLVSVGREDMVQVVEFLELWRTW